MITDEGIARLRQRIGVARPHSAPPRYLSPNEDAFRHVALAYGDDNPLWCDPAYGPTTRWEGPIAPPPLVGGDTLVGSHEVAAVEPEHRDLMKGDPLRGVHAFYGASALVVTSAAFAQAHGLRVLARVTAYATGGGPPKEIFFAPIAAVQNLMKKAGTAIGDYDLIEANEAFAVQALANGRALGWDWERVNVHGGAVALGHPIGASGARILTTLLYAMQDRGARTGLATLCLGGGNAVALSVEQP